MPAADRRGPLLTDHTFESLLLTLSNELAPFPVLD
jgi:hypothetical protein